MFNYINLTLYLLEFLNLFGKIDISSPYIALFLYYYLFIWLPGYYLIKYFFSDKTLDIAEIIPIAFCAGYVFFMPWAFTAYLVKFKLSYFNVFYSFVSLGWFLYNGFLSKRLPDFRSRSGQTNILVILGIVVAASILVSDYFGGFVSGNFLAHVSSIRKMFALDIIEQRSCYFKDLISHPNMYNIYYVFQAAVSKITTIDPVKIWIYLPQFIVPMGVMANFILARRLSGSGAFAALYTVFYFIYFLLYNPFPPADGQAWFLSEQAACNNHLAEGIFLPVIITVFLIYLQPKAVELKNTKLLLLLPLLLLAEGMIHMYVQGQTYFVLFTFAFWALLIKPLSFDYKAAVKPVLYTSLGLLFFFYVYIALSPNINPSYMRLNGTGGSLSVQFFGQWPITDYKTVLLNNPVVWGATIMLLFSLFFVRTDLTSLYIFSIFISVYFILYNPFMMRLGAAVHPPLERVTRMFYVIPLCLGVVYPLWTVFKKEYSGDVWVRRMKYPVIALIALITLLLLKDVPSRLKQIEFTKEYSLTSLERNAQLYKFIGDAIPAGSVVMVNLPFTTWWTTYLPHYIVAHVFDFVISPSYDQTLRKDDVKYFYESPLGPRSAEILKKHGVDYVFFLSSEMQNKALENAGYLAPKASNQMFSIYKVNSNGGVK